MRNKLRSRILPFYRNVCCLLTLLCLFNSTQDVFADGSKDLYPNNAQGSRAFLYCNTAGYFLDSWPFQTAGTHYVYAKSGETIAAGSSAQGYDNGAIRLTAPDGTVYNSTVGNTTGRIGSRNEELGGPAGLPGSPVTPRYTPFQIAVPSGKDGIWKVDFIPPAGESGATNFNVPAVGANASWTQGWSGGSGGNTNGNTIAAWDVSVRTSSAWIPGRTYANVLNLVVNGATFTETQSYYATHYILTKDGRAYRVQTNGNNGVGFTFFSNSNGFAANSIPTYKSLNKSKYGEISDFTHDPRTADDGNNVTHKIFYLKPSPDLPASAPLFLAGSANSTWLKNTAVLPKITDLVVVGVEGTTGQASKKGAYIKFNSSTGGSYRITIPVASGQDRVITGVAATGANSVFWDGKDNAGNFVPAGTTLSSLKTRLLSAEVHFPYIDMEINPKGLIIELTDNTTNYNLQTTSTDEGVYSDRVYWDDSDITGAGIAGYESSSPVANTATGAHSLSGGHVWGLYKSSNSNAPTPDNSGSGAYSFGNNKSMDTWAYIQGSEETKPMNLVVKEADLLIESIIPQTASFFSTGEITYKVRAKNNGPSDVQGAAFSFSVPAGFVINTVSAAVVAGTGAVNNESNSGTVYTAKLDMSNQAVIEYTITGKTNSAAKHQLIPVEASIMRPADVTDPDATNPDPSALTPTDPHLECKNGTATESCNNIKYNTVDAQQLCAGSSIETIGYTLTAGGTQLDVTGTIPPGLTTSPLSGNSVSITGTPTASGTFTLGTQNSAVNNKTVVIQVNPMPVITAQPSLVTACQGTTAVIAVTVSGTGNTYKWQYLNGSTWTDLTEGADQQGVTTATLTLSNIPQSFDGRQLQLIITSAAGCVTTSAPITLKVNPLPNTPVLLPGTLTFCPGGFVTLRSTASAGNRWYKDGILIPGATGQTYVTSEAGKYSLAVVNANGCESKHTAEVEVVLLPVPDAPTITVTGDLTFCQGGSVLLTTTVPSGTTIQWFRGGVVIPGATNPTYTATQTGQYLVIVTNASGCLNNSDPVQVTVNPLPPTPVVTTNGPTTFCAGGSVTLNSSAATGNQWYKNNIIIAGATGPSFTATESGTYTVVTTNTNSCQSNSSVSTVVVVNPKATASNINAADQTICVGATATLTASSAIANPIFKWYTDAALTNKVADGPTYTVTPPVTTTYYVTVSGDGFCENDPNNGKAVTVTVTPKGTAADINVADQTVCAGIKATLTASSAVANPVFKWYSDAALMNKVQEGPVYEVTPLVTTTYYVTVSGTGVCDNAVGAAKAVTVTVTPRGAAADIIAPDQTICPGSSATLTASTTTVSNPVFTWYRDAALTNRINISPTITVSPTVTTTYYVTVSGNGVCENVSGAAKAVVVTVNPTATAANIIAPDQTICPGSSATLTASSTTVTTPIFTWYKDAALTGRISTGPTITVSPTVTTTYYVTVSGDGICANTAGAAKAVVVTVKPTASGTDIIAPDQSICPGSSATLTASSTTITNPIFTWYKDAALTDRISTGPTITVSPTVTTTYYVTVSGDGVCDNASGAAKAVVVTVKPTATAANIIAPDQTICPGSSATLTASSTTVTTPIFTWYRDAALTDRISTGPTITVSPTVTTTYYVTVSGDGICANTAGAAKAVVVTVNPTATAANIIAPDQTICPGSSATLTASSTTVTNPIFTWYRDAALTDRISTGPTITVSPTVTTTYYVTVSGDGICANAAGAAKAVVVTVKPTATGSDIIAPDQSICPGSSATLTASSTTVTNPIFTWYKDAALTDRISTGPTITVSPTVTTTYYVTVSGDGTCANAAGAAKAVVVTIRPTATAADIIAPDQTICPGSSATLTASSTTVTTPIFTWYKDAALTDRISTGPTITVSPTVTTTYYVTVSGDGVCANAAGVAKAVVVTVKPTASGTDIIAPDQSICPGSSATLTASSTTVTNPIFTWYKDAALTDRISISPTITVSPTVTTTYYVTVSGDGICANAAGAAKAVVVTVKPTATGTDIIAPDQTICPGSSATLTASSTTVTNPIFTWYKDAALTDRISTGPTITVSPTVTTTYYVTVSGDGICANTAGAAKAVVVTVKPTASGTDIIAPDQTICPGSSATLTASSTTVTNPIFTWYKDAALTDRISTGPTITVSPTVTTTYYVTVSGDGICANAAGAAKAVVVTVKPTATGMDIIAPDQTICPGSSATLTASSTTVTNPIFTWYKDAALTDRISIGPTITVSPTVTTTYYVTVSGDGICANAAGAAKAVVVTVRPTATAADIIAPDQTICPGSSATLTASSTTVTTPIFTWYKDAALTDRISTGPTITVSPTVTTTYYVTVSGDGVCANAAGVAKAVVVTVKPTATGSDIIAPDQSICPGSSATLTASSTTVTNPIFTWYKDAALTDRISTGPTITVSPTVTTTYYVTVSGDGICANAAGAAKAVVVTVKPTATGTDIIAPDQTICPGSSATLTASSTTVTNPIFTWYKDAALTDRISTGPTITVSPTVTTTYYVTVSGDGICANAAGAAKAVVVTVKPTASGTDIIAPDQTICPGSSATLTASSTTVTNPIFTWYKDAALTDRISTGPTITVSPTVTTTYYVTVSGDGICANAAGAAKAVVVTVKPTATGTDIIAPDQTICPGSSAILTASSTTVTNPIFTWYKDAALTDRISTGPTITVSPTVTTTYYVTVSGDGICANAAGAAKAVVVTVKSTATAADIIAPDQTICPGSSATLTASSTTVTTPIFTWYKDAALTDRISTGPTITVSPTVTTTYYVTVSGDGVCANAAGVAKAVVVTVNPTATGTDIIAPDQSICPGSSATLTASSTTVTTPIFIWYKDAALTDRISTGPTITVSPTVTTTYYVTVSGDGICANAAGAAKAVVVTVKPTATAADIIAPDQSICPGSSATLTASSTTVTTPIFTWYKDAALTDRISTGPTITVSPTVTTTYYVTVSGDGICANAAGAAKAVVVTVKPTATGTDIIAPDQSICPGSSATLTASSTTITNPIFTWYKDAALTDRISTGPTITVSPTVTTTYYVTVSGDGICANAAGAAKAVVVTVKPTATGADIIAPDQSICPGSSAALTASSTTVTNPIFTWYRDAALTDRISTGPTITVSPTVTTTYYVTVSGDGICANAAGAAKAVVVTVKPTATAADIIAPDQTICPGSSATLTASSTTVTNPIFTWYKDAALTDRISTGATITVSPTVTTTYYVTVSGDGVCANAAGVAKAVVVTVNPTATAANIIAPDQSICPGSSATLTASSTTVTTPIFTWYKDAALTDRISTGPTITVSPTVTTTYYVTVSGDGICANAAGAAKAVVVTVNPTATAADIIAPDQSICPGSSATLTASSTTVTHPIFTWYKDAALTNRIDINPTITVSPTVTTTYYVTVSGDGICANTAGAAKAVVVTVKPTATAADIVAPDQSICPGSSSTLTASSTTVAHPIFTWYKDAALTNRIDINPTITVSPTVTTTYYVTVSGDGICDNAAGAAKAVVVTVNPTATAADITALDQSICPGSSATLTAGSTTVSHPIFTWYKDAALTNRIDINPTITVSPTVTTTYYVTVSGDGICENVAGAAKAVVVTVKSTATAADITALDQSICPGSSATLTASTTTVAHPIFTWYKDAALTNRIDINPTITVSPTVTTTYYVTVSGDGICDNAAGAAKAVVVTVKPTATAADITALDQSICPGSSATLTASSTTVGHPIFKWYSDAALTHSLGTNPTITVSPAVTTTYYVTVSGDGICENAAGAAKAVIVTVNPRATAVAIIAADQSVCPGSSATLTASSTTIGHPVFTWYKDAALTDRIDISPTITVTPSVTTTYYVTVSGDGICENAPGTGKPVTVTVNPRATASDIVAADETVCAGGTATLTASSTTVAHPVFRWYRDAALTDRMDTSPTITVSPSVTTTYYVTVSGDGVCENAPNTGKAVKVTVNPRATASDIVAADETVCAGSTATLTVSATTVAHPVFTWYRDAALTNRIDINPTITVTPAVTTTYYVTVSGDGICENAPNTGKAVTVTVNPRGVASDIIIADQAICAGATATLTASSTTISNPVFKWYTDAALRNEVAIGAVYSVTPSATTTFYVTVEGDHTCQNNPGAARIVTVTVNPVPAMPTITAESNTVFCTGGSVVLRSSAATGNQWYKDGLAIPGATGDRYTAMVSGSYTVFVKNVSGCQSVESLPVQVTNSPYPSAPVITPASATTFCDGGSVTLTSSSATGNQWYKNGVLIPGAINQTYVAGEAGKYTVKVTNISGCESGFSAEIIVIINAVPKGFDDVITSLSCTQSAVSYNLQDNVNNTSNGGNAVFSSFSWTVIADPAVKGAVNGSGTRIVATLINTSVTAQDVIYVVTPRAANGGCAGASFKITVKLPVCNSLTITKTANVSQVVRAGDRVRYTITVHNDGQASHTQVAVNDPLTGGLLTNPDGDNGNGILESNETWTYHTTYTVTQADLDQNGVPTANSGKLINTATITSLQLSAPASATAAVNIVSNPALTLVKTGIVSQDHNTITYTFKITNAGNVTLRDLQLTDIKLNGIIALPQRTLAPGASILVTATYTITDAEKGAGHVVNTATVTGLTIPGVPVADISGTAADNDNETDIDIRRPPEAIDDVASTKDEVPVLIPVSANDRPGLFPLDRATINIVTSASRGRLQADLDGNVVYTPDKGFSGTDRFRYKISDTHGIPSNIAMVTIEVAPPDLWIPNTFTPNGDGKNDTFQLKGWENYDGIELTVYNRWGDEVYKNNNYKDQWDGAGLNEGTYFYVIRLKKAGQVEVRRSWVLIKK